MQKVCKNRIFERIIKIFVEFLSMIKVAYYSKQYLMINDKDNY